MRQFDARKRFTLPNCYPKFVCAIKGARPGRARTIHKPGWTDARANHRSVHFRARRALSGLDAPGSDAHCFPDHPLSAL